MAKLSQPKTPQKSTWHFLVLIPLIVGVLVVLLIGWAYFSNAQSSSNDKKHLISKYDKLDVSSILTLKDKKWDPGNLDVAAVWEYSYVAKAERAAVYDALIKSLERGGYKIVYTTKYQDFIYLEEIGKQDNNNINDPPQVMVVLSPSGQRPSQLEDREDRKLSLSAHLTDVTVNITYSGIAVPANIQN